jgi:PDZ domain-containing protein
VTLLVTGALLLAITFLVLWIVPSSSYILLPDKAQPLAPRITVQGAKPQRGPGGIYFVDVRERRATLFEDLFPSIREGSTLVPSSAINPPGVSESARRQADLGEMARSQDVAAAVALKELGYKVTAQPSGAIVTAIFDGTPAVGELAPGDILVSVDGQPVREVADAPRLVAKRKPGQLVRLGVRNSGQLRQVVLKTAADPGDRTRPIIGVQLEQAAQIKLPIPVNIDLGQIGGPSAGLAFALELMEKLGRNVDRGYRVAATGELALDGSVEPIGGVRQKVYGARQAGVDIFLAPAGDNATEARRYAGKVKVIAVKSFRQALQALAKLPPKR